MHIISIQNFLNKHDANYIIKKYYKKLIISLTNSFNLFFTDSSNFLDSTCFFSVSPDYFYLNCENYKNLIINTSPIFF